MSESTVSELPRGEGHGRATRRTARFSPLVVVSVGVVALVAAACGGGSSTNATKPASSQSPTSSTPPGPPPGASGTAAAVSASSLEVQNPTTGQVTVNFGGTTKFSQQMTASASDVVAGACVAATPGQGATNTPGQPFTARTVAITQPDASGSCTAQGAGFGGFGGGGGAGAANGGTTPSTTARSGNNRNPNSNRRFGGAFGKVASVSGASFVVQGNNPRSGPMTTTVTTDPSTTYTKVVPASSSALAVGQCIVATGPSDQTGAVTANTINIRQPGPNGCNVGRGRFGGGGGNGGGGAGGGGGGGSAT